MGYSTTNGIYVDSADIKVAPAAFTTAGSTNGSAIELGSRRVVSLTLATSAITGTGPTLNVTIQTSQDGTNWYTAGTFTQQSSVTSETKTFACARFMRPVFSAAGTGISITASLVGEAV